VFLGIPNGGGIHVKIKKMDKESENQKRQRLFFVHHLTSLLDSSRIDEKFKHLFSWHFPLPQNLKAEHCS
jgi:hypothetical protein